VVGGKAQLIFRLSGLKFNFFLDLTLLTLVATCCGVMICVFETAGIDYSCSTSAAVSEIVTEMREWAPLDLVEVRKDIICLLID
jgi:hypothetical protein